MYHFYFHLVIICKKSFCVVKITADKRTVVVYNSVDHSKEYIKYKKKKKIHY